MNSGSSYDFLYSIGIKKENYNSSPEKSDKEELLNSTIIGMLVLIVPLGKKSGPLFKFWSSLSWVAPARVAGGNFTHASIIVVTEDLSLIRIEYGAYDDKRSGEFKGQVHYLTGDDGLRFVKISKNELQSYYDNDDDVVITCDIENYMTLKDMLNRTKTQGSYHYWDKEDYNILSENCQLFVRKAIQVLGATRKHEIQRNRTIMKMRVPFRVLNAFEDNEKDDYNIIQRIPISGQIFDIAKVFIDIKYA